MKLVFSHGMESGPRGYKINRLALVAERHNLDVESIDYTDTKDADVRVDRLVSVLKQEPEPVILLGSSMGGYASVVASESVQTHAMFLLAPALYMPGFGKQEYASRSPHIEIVHGWADDVVPVDNVIRYARKTACCLHILSEDHSLNGSIEMIESLFDAFLVKVLSS
ncbi:MAG: alpha/beta hydrolase [Gammaproteobacteria bacterium]|nr:alpha/beta hydrolase [Gammaproteobacteria bacterium]